MRSAVLCLTLALYGCAGPGAVSPAGEGDLVELRLKPGDSIHVVTKHRQRATLRITELGPTELSGMTLKPGKHETLPAGQELVIPYGDLAMVKIARPRLPGPGAGVAWLLVLITVDGVISAIPPPMLGP